MRNLSIVARGACISALLLAPTMPVFAQGKADRAREAVAAARAKVEVAAKLGAIGDVPRLQAQAQAALRMAEEDLAGMSKDKAIADANRASELADTAIGVAERNRRADATVNAAVAVDAQQQAAEANARAAAAEQAAANAAADAAAARAAPPPAPVVIQAPAPTTTVTTETVKSTTAAAAPRKRVAKRTVRKVTRKPVVRARAAVTEKTTTTVTTTPN